MNLIRLVEYLERFLAVKNICILLYAIEVKDHSSGLGISFARTGNISSR